MNFTMFPANIGMKKFHACGVFSTKSMKKFHAFLGDYLLYIIITYTTYIKAFF